MRIHEFVVSTFFWACIQGVYAQGVVQLGSITATQIGAGSAIDAAVSGAANPQRPNAQPHFTEESDFLRSMGISVHGDGIATPADFNLGGRVTIFRGGTPAGTDNSNAPGSGRENSGTRDGKDGRRVDGGEPLNAPKGGRRSVSFTDCGGTDNRGGTDNPCGPSLTSKNPVVDRMNQGFEHDPGTAPPTNTRIKGTGIAVPNCTEQSREGLDC